MESSEPPSSSSNTTLIARPAPAEESDEATIYRHALIACIFGMVVNLALAVLKLWVAAISGSSAMFSEGLHSLGDGMNSIMLLVGIIRGKRMPDRTHPFGYGLEANFWALFASVFLFVSGCWAIWEGVRRWHEGMLEHQDYSLAIMVLIVSMLFEVTAIWTASRAILTEVGIPSTWYNAIPKGYLHIKDAKVPTTRYVFFEDSMAFLGAFIAFVALVGSEYFVALGWLHPQFAHIPDAVAAVLIGFLMLMLAYNLFKHNKGILLGAAAPPKVEAQIQRIVTNVHGISHVHNLRTIDQGHSGMIIHMTVEVEPDTPVKDVDDLTERVKEKLAENFKNVRAEQVFIEVLADETEFEWGTQFEALVAQGRKEGVLKPRDEALLRRAYDFTELVVRDVMIPRTDVEYVNIDTPLSEVADRMIETGHTRWPVFRENIDDLLGIVHSRDVFRAIREGRLDASLDGLVREMDIYPENKPVSDLLEEFKRKKLRMAAVADEHGGFAGIVTIEDLMEEIVGEIWDEHEVEEQNLIFLAPARVLVSGKYNVEDLNDSLDLNIPHDEFVTIGGFVFGTLGRVPVKGDQVTFEDLTLTVDLVEGPRIITVLIESPKEFVNKRAQEEAEIAAQEEAKNGGGE